MSNRNRGLDIAIFGSAILAIVAVSVFPNAFAQVLNQQFEDTTVIETENAYIISANTQNEADMLEEVYSSMYQAKQATGLDFMLVQHEDLSLSLYRTSDHFETLTQMTGFNNPNGLVGANGVSDILDAFVEGF